jgi:hypothetical protein
MMERQRLGMRCSRPPLEREEEKARLLPNAIDPAAMCRIDVYVGQENCSRDVDGRSMAAMQLIV